MNFMGPAKALMELIKTIEAWEDLDAKILNQEKLAEKSKNHEQA